MLFNLLSVYILCISLRRHLRLHSSAHGTRIVRGNPVDYRIWGVLQARVYKTPVRDTADFKQRLIENLRRGLTFRRPSSTKPLTSAGFDYKTV